MVHSGDVMYKDKKTVGQLERGLEILAERGDIRVTVFNPSAYREVEGLLVRGPYPINGVYSTVSLNGTGSDIPLFREDYVISVRKVGRHAA